MNTRLWQASRRIGGVVVMAVVCVLTFASPTQAANFMCASGNVGCLINAIDLANANGQANTIHLAAGVYTLAGVHNNTDGPNALPSVISALTITGEGAETTILERFPLFPLARLLHVAGGGALTLSGLTLRYGIIGCCDGDGGGGVRNHGTLTILDSTLVDNTGEDGGGALRNHGTLTLTRSTLVHNNAIETNGGAIYNGGGSVTITDSTLDDNVASEGGGLWNLDGTVTLANSTVAHNSGLSGGGGIMNRNAGVLTLINSTVADNVGDFAGGLLNVGGTVTVTNSTLADNIVSSSRGFGGGGLANQAGGMVSLHNTILARNTTYMNGGSSDCLGLITSLGNNLIGDPSDCTITLQSTDRTGEPGLGPFTDTGEPGEGYFPLLSTSRAIDAGNDVVCPPTDQLDQPRVGRCDIGAVEFQGEVLAALSPAKVWIGLKNSDDVGTNFDLLAEVFKNGTLVGSGQLNNVPGGSSGFNNAKLDEIPLTLSAPVGTVTDDTFSLKLSVRDTCFGKTHNSGTARLWFNDSQANSRFGATIGETTGDFFLRDGFTLSTAPGPGPKNTIDVLVNNKAACPARPFTPFGTWHIALPSI